MERIQNVDSEDSDTEIVVVSDTVRLRRARTPISAGESPGGRDRAAVPGAQNLPDLLPNTFRLAEQSSLFSNIDADSVTHRAHENYMNGKASQGNTLTLSRPQVSHITLEKVQYFEPEHAETVNIVDLSEDNASDTSEGCATARDDPLGSVRNESKSGDVKRFKTERINSFYESDKEGHEEPLVFSEDEDTEFEVNPVLTLKS